MFFFRAIILFPLKFVHIIYRLQRKKALFFQNIRQNKCELNAAINPIRFWLTLNVHEMVSSKSSTTIRIINDSQCTRYSLALTYRILYLKNHLIWLRLKWKLIQFKTEGTKKKYARYRILFSSSPARTFEIVK